MFGAGFGIRSKGWEHTKNCLKLTCERFKEHTDGKPKEDDPKTKATKRVPSTKKAVTKEETCNFLFSVHWCPIHNRWFLPTKQAGNKKHNGHIHRGSDITPARSSDLPESERTLLGDLNEMNAARAVMDNLILKRNEFSLSEGRLEHLRRQQKELQFNRDLSDSLGPHAMTKPKTPADRLLARFDNDPKANYIALYAEYDTTRLTIKKKSKFRQNHSIEKVSDSELISQASKLSSKAAKVEDTESEVDPSELKDAATSAKIEAEKLRKSIRDNLKVTTEEGRILLALVWTDKESRNRFDMFPELVAADCTYGINKEERPVMLFSSIDGNNQTFTHTWAYLPSESKWVFNWVLETALPSLHNRSTLEKVRLFLTDQDGQLMCATKHNIGKGNSMPGAVDRICAWHKLCQNLTNSHKFRAQLKSNVNSEDSARAEWNAIVSWLWDLCLRVKLVQANDQYRRLEGVVVDCDEFPKHTPTESRKWFTDTSGAFLVKPKGYWATDKGKALVAEAEKLVKEHRVKGLRPFGDKQVVSASTAGPFGLPEGVYQGDTETQDSAGDAVTESSTLLQPPREWIDSEYTLEDARRMTQNWNPQRDFEQLHKQMYQCMSNNETNVLLYTRTLHYLHEDMLRNVRLNEPTSSQTGGMVSVPSNLSGSKTSNKRHKRAHEKDKDKDD